MTTENQTSYLGDGVYATFDEFGVMLTTEHHKPECAKNVVWLDPEISENLVNFIKLHLPGLPCFKSDPQATLDARMERLAEQE